MEDRYYFDVDYKCACEVCEEEFGGLIRRGPLEYTDDTPTGKAAAMDDADTQQTKRMIENALHKSSMSYIVQGVSICPHCGARQSWCPPATPKVPGSKGGYVAVGFGGAMLGMIIWLFVSFFVKVTSVNPMVPPLICLLVGAGLGVLVVHIRRLKRADEVAAKYAREKSEYDAYWNSIEERPYSNEPEILWETARRTPCDL